MPNDHPNVLLVTVDHWPASLLGCAGHPMIQTPTLDRLASSGVRFTNAYSECPVCVPARRSLMTGISPRTHGDRSYNETAPMHPVTTIAQAFRDAGYQAHAVGKLHTFPQRSRIGFDDVQLDEEGRAQYGLTDDYEIFLADNGYAGRQFMHGMSNNTYESRPWHLPERLHATNWAAEQMARQIKRRDPTRPGFWYLAFRHPHPPMVPLQIYLDMYDVNAIPEPETGEWCERQEFTEPQRHARRMAQRAFYALCTHIDHQLRIVLGTLRDERLLDNTIICFASDHGDMLGTHNIWGKWLFYEDSANVPMIILGRRGEERIAIGATDDRLVALRDVMPTLLDLAGVPVPPTVEGLSMVRDEKRSFLYGEIRENTEATRMIHDGRFKLIYYPAGNRFQLFDLTSDPRELVDLVSRSEHQETVERLSKLLIGEMYGIDVNWIRDGKLVGMPMPEKTREDERHLHAQRGLHFPPPMRL